MTMALFQSDRTRERVALVSRGDFQPRPLTHDELRLLNLLAAGHMGKLKAIPIARICATTGLAEREIKAIIATLRRTPYRVPIASSRDGKAGGIFLAETDDERREAAEYMVRQAYSELELAGDMLEATEFQTATAPIRTLLQGGAR